MSGTNCFGSRDVILFLTNNVVQSHSSTTFAFMGVCRCARFESRIGLA
jgi:hypothetical protein